MSLVEEFLREDKLEHSTECFLTTRKTVLKKAASKSRGSFLWLCGQVLEFKCEYRLLFTGNKETAQFSYMTWRE